METMELLLILLILLCVLVTAADGNSPVVVKEDSDVVLPCSLSSKENLESKLFDWKKDVEKGEEKRVFMYNGGIYSGRDFEDQDKHFEGRVSHFPHELKNGNASIKITKTKVSDSGTYTCIFPRLQPSQTVSIQLVVGACPEPSVTTLKVTKDQALLQCVVRGASPKPVVQWRNSSGNILSAEETKVQQNGDSFDLVLQSNVTKSGRYSCVITQNDICHQISSDIDVDIHGAASKPAVRILDQSKDQALLQCEVYGASPKPMVSWSDSSRNILPAKESQVTERGGSYDIILQTTVTKSDHYSCVVRQEEINHQTEAETYVHISVSGPPVGWIVFVVIVAVVFIIIVVLGFRKVQKKNQALQEQNQSLQEQMQILKDQVQSLQECPHQPGSGIL